MGRGKIVRLSCNLLKKETLYTVRHHVGFTDLWSHEKPGYHDQGGDLLVQSAPPREKMDRRPCRWMLKPSRSKSGRASGSPAAPW